MRLVRATVTERGDGMINGGMARRLEALEAQVSGATLMAEQREAEEAAAQDRLWTELQARGEQLRDFATPAAEALDHESARDLVARLLVVGEVGTGPVVEAIRRRLVWLEERGEGEDAVTRFLRRVLDAAQAPDDVAV